MPVVFYEFVTMLLNKARHMVSGDLLRLYMSKCCSWAQRRPSYLGQCDFEALTSSFEVLWQCLTSVKCFFAVERLTCRLGHGPFLPYLPVDCKLLGSKSRVSLFPSETWTCWSFWRMGDLMGLLCWSCWWGSCCNYLLIQFFMGALHFHKWSLNWLLFI